MAGKLMRDLRAGQLEPRQHGLEMGRRAAAAYRGYGDASHRPPIVAKDRADDVRNAHDVTALVDDRALPAHPVELIGERREVGWLAHQSHAFRDHPVASRLRL